MPEVNNSTNNEDDEERIETTTDPTFEAAGDNDLGGREVLIEEAKDLSAECSPTPPDDEKDVRPMNVDQGSQLLNVSIDDFQVSGVEFSFGKNFMLGESGSQSDKTAFMGLSQSFNIPSHNDSWEL